MGKIRKTLPKILISLLIITLASAILLASVYAKYISSEQPDPNVTRPAAFEVVIEDEYYPGIASADFAIDGEPGSPLGYSAAEKYYNIKVTNTSNSEVSVYCQIEIIFSPKVYEKIIKAREDRISEGVCCDFDVFEKGDDGKWIPLESVETEIETAEGTALKSVSNGTSIFGRNLTENVDDSSDYRVVMTFYNSTDMSGSNGKYYFFDSDGVEVNVMAVQVDPS